MKIIYRRLNRLSLFVFIFFFQAEDGIRDGHVTGVQTCALPISQIWRQCSVRIDLPMSLSSEGRSMLICLMEVRQVQNAWQPSPCSRNFRRLFGSRPSMHFQSGRSRRFWFVSRGIREGRYETIMHLCAPV